MNLWIRSQDKEELLKINNRIFVKEITNAGFSIENDLCVDDGFISLGIYNTKERALEVLDEIKNKLMRQEIGQNTLVYEMPKE